MPGREACWLCDRPLGARVEWHHPVPKSRGGKETVAVHPICHRATHMAIDNKALATQFSDRASLRTHPDIAKFLAWIATKPPDFYAPTRRARR